MDNIKDIFEIFKELFPDPIIFIPLAVGAIFLILCWRKGWKKTFATSLILLISYLIGSYHYATHVSSHVITKNKFEEAGRASIAVLCFHDIDQNYDNGKNFRAFRYWLTRTMRHISEIYMIDIIDHNEVVEEDNLINNVNLTRNKATQIGKRLKADLVIYGEISTIRPILITLNVLNTKNIIKVLEIELRSRMASIPVLAQEASEQILNNLRKVSKQNKNNVHDRLSDIRTNILAAKFFSEGLNEFFKNNHEKSILALNKAIDEDSRFPDPHFLLAFIYFYKNRDELVIKELAETIKLAPNWADPHYFMGVVLKRIGNYPRAGIEYEKAIELENRLVYKMIYRSALAGINLKLGKVNEALEIINEIEEAETTHRKVLYNLAARYSELGELDKALSLLQDAMESGLSSYDCKAALADPDFDNFKQNPTKYRYFKELLEQCK